MLPFFHFLMHLNNLKILAFVEKERTLTLKLKLSKSELKLKLLKKSRMLSRKRLQSYRLNERS